MRRVSRLRDKDVTVTDSSAVFIAYKKIFQKKLCECFLGGKSGRWSLVALQVIMVPRCKHLLALFSHPHNSSWPPPPPLLLSPLSHRQVQLDCQAELCLPPSLYLFIFLSVCLKNRGRNNLHGHQFTISLPPIRAPSAQTETKCFHLNVRARVLGIHLE